MRTHNPSNSTPENTGNTRDADSTGITRNSRDKPRCVLLIPRGFHPPQDLLAGLLRRGVAIRECSDAPAVMLALAESRCSSIVIIEPDAMPDSPALAKAVHRYHATVAIWQYRWIDNTGRLSPYDSADAPVASNPPSIEPPAPTPVVNRDEHGDDEPFRLSEEELAMLLGPDEGDAHTESSR